MDRKASRLAKLTVLLFGANALPVAAMNAAEADIIGEARDQKQGELLYHELHFFNEKGLDHRVIYKAPDGKVLAEKSLDYSASDLQPQLSQKNFACGESIEVTYADDALEVSYRADQQDAVKIGEVEEQIELVIDAGFDNMIRKHWERVTAGDPLTFDYLVPSRFASYSFRLKNVDCSEDAADGFECFLIEPASWWLRMLVDPVSLTYEGKSRRLLKFKGLGNVAGADCKYPQVKIRYQYAEQAQEEGGLVRF